VLDKLLRVSTPKINLMLEEAIEAGAYGGKINGSGGGGSMFVYAPENTKGIAEAIERVGGKAYIVRVDEGLESELSSE
jgi:galactokinase